jgi:hypothetical protein
MLVGNAVMWWPRGTTFAASRQWAAINSGRRIVSGDFQAPERLFGLLLMQAAGRRDAAIGGHSEMWIPPYIQPAP